MRNNRQLYETIMARVAREVKRALNEATSNFNLRKGAIVRDDEFDNDDVTASDTENARKDFMQRCIDDILNDRIDEYNVQRFNRYLTTFLETKYSIKLLLQTSLKI